VETTEPLLKSMCSLLLWSTEPLTREDAVSSPCLLHWNAPSPLCPKPPSTTTGLSSQVLMGIENATSQTPTTLTSQRLSIPLASNLIPTNAVGPPVFLPSPPPSNLYTCLYTPLPLPSLLSPQRSTMKTCTLNPLSRPTLSPMLLVSGKQSPTPTTQREDQSPSLRLLPAATTPPPLLHPPSTTPPRMTDGWSDSPRTNTGNKGSLTW